MALSNSSQRDRPRSLARYMAASASRMSVSGSASVSSGRAMPMLTPTNTSVSSMTNGPLTASSTRSAMAMASCWVTRSSQSTTNSSPPKRATVSPGRRATARRSAMATSSRSPRPWPRLSFTTLKWSRSRNSTATRRLWRRARASAPSSRSSSSVRLGRPVSGSWVAWWASRCSNALRSLMSWRIAEKYGPSSVVAGVQQHLGGHRHEPDVGHEHRQLAAPSDRAARPRADLDAEPLGDRRREQVLDDVAGDLVVGPKPNGPLGRRVQVEQRAVGVADADEVLGGLEDVDQPLPLALGLVAAR